MDATRPEEQNIHRGFLGWKQKLRCLFMSFNFYSLKPKVQEKPSPSFPFCCLSCCVTTWLLELPRRQWTAK